jgi:uncharacterized protein YjbI with pentapeptide repeats
VLRDADLTRATLRAARFDRTDLIGADLTGVDLAGLQWHGSRMDQGQAVLVAQAAGVEVV